MVDIVVHGERHLRVGAVDRRRRCIEQMPAAIVPAALENGGEAGEIGIDISKRIDQRMTNAGLRREMNDIRKAVLLEQCGHAVAVGKVELDEAQAIGFGELGATRFLQRRIVIGIHIVEPDNVAAVAQQTLRDMKADEAGRAGDEDGAVSHRICPALSIARAATGRFLPALLRDRACLDVQNNALAVLEQLPINGQPPAT